MHELNFVHDLPMHFGKQFQLNGTENLTFIFKPRQTCSITRFNKTQSSKYCINTINPRYPAYNPVYHRNTSPIHPQSNQGQRVPETLVR